MEGPDPIGQVLSRLLDRDTISRFQDPLYVVWNSEYLGL